MVKMKLSAGILAALTVLLLPQSGLAQRQPDPNAMFERLDQNRDGVLTQDELPEQRQEFFDLMLQRGDTDQDGRLTREEFTASLSDASGRPQFGGRSQQGPGGGQGRPMRGQRLDPERIFERLDSNGDGTITADEVPEQAQRILQLDRDGDGVITREEISQGLPGGRFGQPRGMAPGGPGERAERMFEELDSNGDGRVTKEEVPDGMEQFLERFDRDGDGMVTEDEVSGQPFQGSGPAVGQSLPDLTVYDAQGKEFKLSSLKGNYSVLVFGCLT